MFALFFLFVCVSLSLRPHHWEGERRRHVLQELVHLQWKVCCIVHPLSTSAQSEREEVTLKMGGNKAAADTSTTSPPQPHKPEDPADDDIFEFTSATEGEASSAWDLVPEPKIARKKGVKSDTEIDTMLKKAIKEAELPEKGQINPKDVTSSSAASSTPKKDAVTSIPEDLTAEAAEEAGDKAEAQAAEKAITAAWEADFSLEDAPTPVSKDVLTTGMGRKNLMVAGVTPEDDDSEMAEADPEAAASHLGSSAKRKGRSTSQGAAQKRALPLKSPRAAFAGPKAKSPPAEKPASANKMPRAASPQGKAASKAVGKPAVKPPPKAITPLGAPAAPKPPPKAVTSKPPPSKEDRAWADWEKAKAKVAERQQQEHLAAPQSPPLFAVDWGRFASREALLQKISEVYRLDANSAKGYNHHVAAYYYISTDWGVSHPQSYSSIMLKNDSRQTHRWTCPLPSFSPRDRRPQSSGGRHDSLVAQPLSPLLLGLAREGHSFQCHHRRSLQGCPQHRAERSTPPLGGAFHMLPNALPSHPKGLDKRLFKPP